RRVPGLRDQIAAILQKPPQQPADSLVVVNDQNMRVLGRHSPDLCGFLPYLSEIDTAPGAPGPSLLPEPAGIPPQPAARRCEMPPACVNAVRQTDGAPAPRLSPSAAAGVRAGRAGRYGFQPAHPRSACAAPGSATAWSPPARPEAPSQSDRDC